MADAERYQHPESLSQTVEIELRERRSSHDLSQRARPLLERGDDGIVDAALEFDRMARAAHLARDRWAFHREDEARGEPLLASLMGGQADRAFDEDVAPELRVDHVIAGGLT